MFSITWNILQSNSWIAYSHSLFELEFTHLKSSYYNMFSRSACNSVELELREFTKLKLTLQNSLSMELLQLSNQNSKTLILTSVIKRTRRDPHFGVWVISKITLMEIWSLIEWLQDADSVHETKSNDHVITTRHSSFC